MDKKGKCEIHGEFILTEGCPGCLAERRAAGIRPEQDEMEAGLNTEGLTLAGAEPATADNIKGRLSLSEEAGGATVGELIMNEPVAETAIALRPGEDIEARGYYEEALRCLEFAEARVIVNFEDLTLATDDLSALAKLKKVMENKRKSLLDPLKLQSDTIRDTYNYLMAPVLEADKITRDKMLAFDKEQRRIRAEQEEINRKRQEAAEAEMRLRGELTEPVGLVEVTPEAPKRVETDMGTTGMVDHWKYEVVDPLAVPREYLMVDTAMLSAIAKKHHDQKPVPGVRFYNEPIIAVRAR